MHDQRPRQRRLCVLVCCFLCVLLAPALARAQIRARPRAEATPAWDKGIQPISPATYYHAIDCGKQGGDDPPCVFWDTGLCRNDHFALALYTPYKQVAYEVWTAVRQQQAAPTPDYQAAQRTRVTVGLTPVRGSKNVLTGFSLKRAGKTVPPIDGSIASARFTYDFPAFAPSSPVTFEMAGQTGTLTCTIDAATLRTFR